MAKKPKRKQKQSDKSKILGVRLQNEEFSQVEELAAAEGLKPGGWGRKVILQELIGVLTFDGLPATELDSGCPKCSTEGPESWYCPGCGAPSHEPAPNELITCEHCQTEGVAFGVPPVGLGYITLKNYQPLETVKDGEEFHPALIHPRKQIVEIIDVPRQHGMSNLPPGLVSTGWAEDSLKPGDKVTIASTLVVNPAKARLSWAQEWAAMERMDPQDAMNHMAELCAGRELPDGFRGWPKAEKINWLERHWLLEQPSAL